MKRFLISLLLVFVISLSPVFLASCNKDKASTNPSTSEQQQTNSGENTDGETGENTDSGENGNGESGNGDNTENNGNEFDEGLITFTSVCPCFFSNKVLYDVEYCYSDNYFTKSSYEFNKNIAKTSLGLSVVGKERDSNHAVSMDFYIKDYFNNMGFNNVYLCSDYYVNPTSETICYCFAHKKIGDFDVISVVIGQVYFYGAEWANNFLISDTGHHLGFYENAKRVYNDLKNYVKTNNYDENILKIWATGYSRGGGISNLLGVTINDEIDGKNELSLEKTNVYIYTFEAPQGVNLDYGEVKNIHNIVNNNDIVTKLSPSIYGHKRAGTDYDISTGNALEIIKAFDSNIQIEKFCQKQLVSSSNGVSIVDVNGGYTEVNTLFNKFFKILFKNYSDQSVSLATRELYKNNYEHTITEILNFVFNLSDYQLNQFTQSLSEKFNSTVFMNLMTNSEDTLYNIVKDALTDAGIDYNDDNLKLYTSTIQNLLYAMISSSFSVISDFATIAGNISFIGGMHDSLITYILLDYYNCD